MLDQEYGFTLLEVMVAFVIFATVGITVFSWINNSLSSVQRVREVGKTNSLTLNALELVKMKNPMVEPEGEVESSGLIVKWNSVSLGVPIRQRKGGLYLVALYRVDIEVEDSETQYEVLFSFVQSGYKQEGQVNGI